MKCWWIATEQQTSSSGAASATPAAQGPSSATSLHSDAGKRQVTVTTLPLDFLLWHKMCQSSVHKAIASFHTHRVSKKTNPLDVKKSRHVNDVTPLLLVTRQQRTQNTSQAQRPPCASRSSSPAGYVASPKPAPPHELLEKKQNKPKELALLSCSCVTHSDVELLCSSEDQLRGKNF